MDAFSHFSDPLHFCSGFWSPELPESSTGSDGGSARPPANFSDEEVLLASRYPKKRAGRKKFRETRHPVFRGVRRRNSGKWVCEVREPNKKTRIWLGTFPTAEMAARAHDVAAIALRGRSACLNFADSAWKLPVPTSSDPKDIQKAADQAAEAFRVTQSDGVPCSCEDVRKPEEEGEATMPEQVFFMDDEAVFGMPGLLTNMAEGLMLPPPQSAGGDGYGVRQDSEFDLDDFLWSYSI